ncbi:MAG: excinuclease ABC subunit UvrC [Promethearchaeota archaeon]|nr:MAG: excinuclease ABC subunit UvrC [Candidatus Lokiarchaeota archaeon]
MSDLELQRKSLPNEPGVYLFLDRNNNIIYIGKAKNLRKRVNQYFLKTHYTDPYYEEKIQELVKNIANLEFIVTENEKEASILENIQIKNHQPRFNVFMRDSKTYPWVAIFYSEDYPRIRVIRGPEKYSKENLFLGPYTDKKEIIRILRDLRKLFPYCSCKKKIKPRKRPCLYYQLKLCPGPCIGAISKKDYRDNIKKIELFLKGETTQLKQQVRDKMKAAANELDFEVAAFWRDKLHAIDHSTSTQNVILDSNENKDIIGYHNDKDQQYIAVIIIHIREGKIINRSSFLISLKEKIFIKSETLSSIISQFYQNLSRKVPDTIILSELYNEIEVVKQILEEHNPKIKIRTPLEAEFGLLRIANKNAKVMVNQALEMESIKRKAEEKILKALEDAKDLFLLPDIPRIIEGFDISNIEGKDATGSMVYFLEGKPYKKYYRHYNIRSKSTPDDVAMIKEVIKRRYTMLLEKNYTLPDLILVDGGKGQLNAAHSVLKDLGIDGISIIGLAKRFEEIYVPDKKDPINLPMNSPLLELFQQVRDEAHRFAVRLHKKRRIKRITSSKLDDIKGIGPTTRTKLLTHFGSLANIKKASQEEISQVVGTNLAKTIIKELKNL